ncbi:MAG: hypothetical protein J1F35_03660 [Erysipelotrichales bacterium]|nr:hypothetical protein [Erysipelotrichales bacterium]
MPTNRINIYDISNGKKKIIGGDLSLTTFKEIESSNGQKRYIEAIDEEDMIAYFKPSSNGENVKIFSQSIEPSDNENLQKTINIDCEDNAGNHLIKAEYINNNDKSSTVEKIYNCGEGYCKALSAEINAINVYNNDVQWNGEDDNSNLVLIGEYQIKTKCRNGTEVYGLGLKLTNETDFQISIPRNFNYVKENGIYKFVFSKDLRMPINVSPVGKNGTTTNAKIGDLIILDSEGQIALKTIRLTQYPSTQYFSSVSSTNVIGNLQCTDEKNNIKIGSFIFSSYYVDPLTGSPVYNDYQRIEFSEENNFYITFSEGNTYYNKTINIFIDNISDNRFLLGEYKNDLTIKLNQGSIEKTHVVSIKAIFNFNRIKLKVNGKGSLALGFGSYDLSTKSFNGTIIKSISSGESNVSIPIEYTGDNSGKFIIYADNIPEEYYFVNFKDSSDKILTQDNDYYLTYSPNEIAKMSSIILETKEKGYDFNINIGPMPNKVSSKVNITISYISENINIEKNIKPDLSFQRITISNIDRNTDITVKISKEDISYNILKNVYKYGDIIYSYVTYANGGYNSTKKYVKSKESITNTFKLTSNFISPYSIDLSDYTSNIKVSDYKIYRVSGNINENGYTNYVVETKIYNDNYKYQVENDIDGNFRQKIPNYDDIYIISHPPKSLQPLGASPSNINPIIGPTELDAGIYFKENTALTILSYPDDGYSFLLNDSCEPQVKISQINKLKNDTVLELEEVYQLGDKVEVYYRYPISLGENDFSFDLSCEPDIFKSDVSIVSRESEYFISRNFYTIPYEVSENGAVENDKPILLVLHDNLLKNNLSKTYPYTINLSGGLKISKILIRKGSAFGDPNSYTEVPILDGDYRQFSINSTEINHFQQPGNINVSLEIICPKKSTSDDLCIDVIVNKQNAGGSGGSGGLDPIDPPGILPPNFN